MRSARGGQPRSLLASFMGRTSPAELVAALAALVVALIGAYRYTQTRYYVGFAGDRVAVYQGVQGSIGPLQLSHVVQETNLTRSQLSPYARDQVDGTINADSDDYVESPEEWQPLAGALKAIARLNHAGWHVVVASNQSLFELALGHQQGAKNFAAGRVVVLRDGHFDFDVAAMVRQVS